MPPHCALLTRDPWSRSCFSGDVFSLDRRRPYLAFLLRFGADEAAGSATAASVFPPSSDTGSSSALDAVGDSPRAQGFAYGRLLRLRLRVLREAAFQAFHQIDDLGRFGDRT